MVFHRINLSLAYLGTNGKEIFLCGVSPYMADIRAGDMMKVWQNDNIERRDELVRVLDINLDWKMHAKYLMVKEKSTNYAGIIETFKLLINEFLNELDVVIETDF